MHARLLARLISLDSLGSIQILRLPQFSTLAASRFCSFREIPIVSVCRCRWCQAPIQEPSVDSATASGRQWLPMTRHAVIFRVRARRLRRRHTRRVGVTHELVASAFVFVIKARAPEARRFARHAGSFSRSLFRHDLM